MGMLHHKLTEPVCFDLKAMNAVHGKYNEEKQQSKENSGTWWGEQIVFSK